MTDDHPFDHDDLSESSEATLIVDANTLRQARAQHKQERDQAYLIVISGPHTGKMFKVDKAQATLGRSSRADIRVNDVGISRNHARVIAYGDDVFVEDLESANGTYLNGDRLLRRQQLKDGDKITLGSTTILKFTYHDELEENFQKQMLDAALNDGLTGIYNKNYLLNHLSTELAFALRHGTYLSVVMFDVDHFKPVNDTYGHLAGDMILRRLAEVTSATLRNEDVFARYGGEEFTIVCRGTPIDQAQALADRVRMVIERTSFVYEGTPIPITISLGVAGLPHHSARTPEELIGLADQALYDAKHGGRNRVGVAPF
ncbi:GGDEF domain-containing protein [Lujinxingia litoralis]|uniref:GGDEF domain-containing protein n=1 Tax=Lujinxingia litoralis TaxID=2211119 RepID=A0A328C398_9DELT|nr:GGDEF domain-containing protein [Lujinxingia litoralis]RAL20267.1 GGDEF domain-containing protein [Lujinxingia litoralis]